GRRHTAYRVTRQKSYRDAGPAPSLGAHKQCQCPPPQYSRCRLLEDGGRRPTYVHETVCPSPFLGAPHVEPNPGMRGPTSAPGSSIPRGIRGDGTDGSWYQPE